MSTNGERAPGASLRAGAKGSSPAQSTCSAMHPTQKPSMGNGLEVDLKLSQGQKKRARKAKRKRCNYRPVIKPAADAVKDVTSASPVVVENVSLPAAVVTDNVSQASTVIHQGFVSHSSGLKLVRQLKKMDVCLKYFMHEHRAIRNNGNGQG